MAEKLRADPREIEAPSPELPREKAVIAPDGGKPLRGHAAAGHG
jgi:hypothetical protein